MYRKLLCLLLALTLSALPALAENDVIPEEYRGVWTCVFGMSDGTALQGLNQPQIVITSESITLISPDGSVISENACSFDAQGYLMPTEEVRLTLLGEGVLLLRSNYSMDRFTLIYQRIGSENPFVGTWTSVLYFIGGVQQETHVSLTFYEDEMCDIVTDDWQADYIDCYYHDGLCVFNGATAFVDASGMLIMTERVDGEDHVVILTRTDK